MIPPWLVVLMVLNVTWAAILIVVSILGMASYDAFCVKNENQAVFILMRILIVFVSTASILGTGFVALTLRD